MTWGFSVDWLGLIEEMAAAGVAAWWFEAERLAARRKIMARPTIVRHGVLQPGTSDVSRFDQQFGALASHWAEIAAIFGDRVTGTLGPDGAYLDPETIFSHLADAAKEGAS